MQSQAMLVLLGEAVGAMLLALAVVSAFRALDGGVRPFSWLRCELGLLREDELTGLKQSGHSMRRTRLGGFLCEHCNLAAGTLEETDQLGRGEDYLSEGWRHEQFRRATKREQEA